jgi:uncharacterized protein YjbJ (UPF0337 family)
VDKDRVEGIEHNIAGSLKEGLGKLVGDAKLQTDGATEKAAGRAQNAVGGLKDAVRETIKR